jgi:hypothetical protein
MNGPVLNTDRELWREPPGDYYANSVHVTAQGGLGINVGGTVIVRPLREWHTLAKATPTRSAKTTKIGLVRRMVARCLKGIRPTSSSIGDKL